MHAHDQQGFAYVEVAVAVLLLALCVMPATTAVRNGLNAPGVALAKLRELRCMQASMESVLAQPYKNLWDAARGTLQTTSYSQPADANCVQRDVYITKYRATYGQAPVFLPYPDAETEQQLEDVLLYVSVSSPDTPYGFTTLVAR